MTGGTGLLGNAIGRRLARGHQIIVLSREGKQAKSRVQFPCELFPWDGKSELSHRLLEGVDVIIHLAGENIAQGRWTEDRKVRLRESRTGPLKQFDKALKANNRPLKLLISASAVGIYGDRGDEELTEKSAPGEGFLAELCNEWEASALAVGARRTLLLRFGVVLSSEGGFVVEVLKMFKRFGAARLGSGRQWISWIHIDDVVEIIAQALSNPSFSGTVNVVSPNPVTNSEMTGALAQVSRAFRVPPAPAFVLKLLYGEISQVLLSSQRVKPVELIQMRWKFKFSDLATALKTIRPTSGPQVLS
jgi:uncharacterized protein (TIGR01777 family)